MLLTSATAHGVADGSVQFVHRRWARAHVAAGSTFVTQAGVIRVDSIDEVTDAVEKLGGLDERGGAGDPVFRIGLSYVGPDPRHALAADAAIDEASHTDLAAGLGRLDQRSSHGAWTLRTLELIAAHPGRRAADLAEQLGRDKDKLKLDIRKLKNLGLTLSLETGYQISSRGQAYLDLTQAKRRSPQ